MRTLLITSVFFFLLTSCSTSQKIAPIEKRELLALHETEAQFEGLRYKKCMGRTTECPDKCGKSGEIATFTILNYLNFESHSKYGKKQKAFHVQISDFNKKKLDKAPELPAGLKKGDKVNLSWKHEYVTKNHSSYPEYTVIKIAK